MLIVTPVPIWIPKMADSGTPSTTEPTTMPIAPPAPAVPNFLSTNQSPARKTATPISIHSTVSHSSMCACASGTRSKAIAEIIAPAPKPARIPTSLRGHLEPADEQAGDEQRRLREHPEAERIQHARSVASSRRARTSSGSGENTCGYRRYAI